MEIDKVKELVQLMVDNDLLSISLHNGTERITLRRPDPNAKPQIVFEPAPVAQAVPPVAAPVPPAATSVAAPTSAGDAPGADAIPPGLVAIVSPMVGTYYESSHPGSPAFVQPGSAVTPDKAVCIIEAMKVFNEIPADVAGTIEEVLVSNEQPVEFGQRLFLVRPA